jgi:hypothetical protein
MIHLRSNSIRSNDFEAISLQRFLMQLPYRPCTPMYGRIAFSGLHAVGQRSDALLQPLTQGNALQRWMRKNTQPFFRQIGDGKP